MSQIQFSHLSLNALWCDQMINVALRPALPQPMTPVTHRQSDHKSIHHLQFCPHLQERDTFSTYIYFPLLVMEAGERGEPGVEAALGWRCANGERVHSPTHPFPVLSRSIIVERWRWEPRSHPTPTPAAPPSAAAKQPPASPVYAFIYIYIHPYTQSFIHLSVHKKGITCGLKRSCLL